MGEAIDLNRPRRSAEPQVSCEKRLKIESNKFGKNE